MDINDLFANGLNLNDALDLLADVSVYVVGIAVYAVFVFNFYRFLAAKNMFRVDLSRYEQSRFRFVRSLLSVFFYVVKYIILFPFFAFFWFAVLTLILAFLSKDRSFADTLLVALATVSAIRVTAYYKEDLSRDLAKILPLAVLAAFLIDASFFPVGDFLDVLREAEEYTENILYYLLFLVGLEFALRLLNGVVVVLLRPGKRALKMEEATPESGAAEAKQNDRNRGK